MWGRVRKSAGQVRGQVSVAIGMGAALILIGSILFRWLMDISWSEAFYFSVVTLSTVGYGDVTPETDFQRVVVALYVLIGVTIFVTAIGIVGVNVIEKRQERVAEKITAVNAKLYKRIMALERRMDRKLGRDGASEVDQEPPSEEKEVT